MKWKWWLPTVVVLATINVVAERWLGTAGKIAFLGLLLAVVAVAWVAEKRRTCHGGDEDQGGPEGE